MKSIHSSTSTKVKMVFLALVQGYSWAWVSHFCIEKNKPATFKYPLWSFFGDLTMMFDIIRGRIPLLGELPKDCYRGTVED